MRWISGEEAASLKPTVNKGIAQDGVGKLWYWDETNTSACGPFDTLVECLRGIEGYVKYLKAMRP